MQLQCQNLRDLASCWFFVKSLDFTMSWLLMSWCLKMVLKNIGAFWGTWGLSSSLEFQAFCTSVYLKSCLLSLSYIRLIFMGVYIFVIQAWIIHMQCYRQIDSLAPKCHLFICFVRDSSTVCNSISPNLS